MNLNTSELTTPVWERFAQASCNIRQDYYQDGIDGSAQAGYCIDAPSLMPAGSVRRDGGYKHFWVPRDDAPTPASPTAAEIEEAASWAAWEKALGARLS